MIPRTPTTHTSSSPAPASSRELVKENARLRLQARDQAEELARAEALIASQASLIAELDSVVGGLEQQVRTLRQELHVERTRSAEVERELNRKLQLLTRELRVERALRKVSDRKAAASTSEARAARVEAALAKQALPVRSLELQQEQRHSAELQVQLEEMQKGKRVAEQERDAATAALDAALQEFAAERERLVAAEQAALVRAVAEQARAEAGEEGVFLETLEQARTGTLTATKGRIAAAYPSWLYQVQSNPAASS